MSSHTLTGAPCIQSLPIRTPFYGTTDVERNFSAQTTRDADGVFHNALRGRPLLGKEVCMPEGYCVAVAEFVPPSHSAGSTEVGRSSTGAAGTSMRAGDGRCPSDALEPAVMQLTNESSAYLLWEHDQLPAGVDAVQQWIALSAVLHA